MTIFANPINNQFPGFVKGSMPVTDANGYILQQKVPADGMVLVADSTQATGWNYVTPDTAAFPTVTMSGVFGTPYVLTSSNGTYNLTFNGDNGILTYARNNAIYFLNTHPALSPSSIASSGQTVTNGYSYDINNTTASPFAVTLSYVATNSGEYGIYAEKVELFSTGTGTFSLSPQSYPIQFGNQTVPVGGHLVSNNLGDSVTLRMNNAKTKWFVLSSIGTFTITTS